MTEEHRQENQGTDNGASANGENKSGAATQANAGGPGGESPETIDTQKTVVSAQAGGSGEAPPTQESPKASDPLEEARAEAQKMKENWMRSAADFDNFRKRARKEADDARKAGKEDILKELLPVFDNLERALTSSQSATDVKAVVDGLTMILKQFEAAIGRAGVAKLKSVGLPFDPTVHEAIQQMETDEHAPGTVVSEIQSGYTQADRLIRAAMVVVAKPKSS